LEHCIQCFKCFVTRTQNWNDCKTW
jgi:hypothetical protein